MKQSDFVKKICFEMSESQSAENHSKSNNNFQTMDMDNQVSVAKYLNCNE